MIDEFHLEVARKQKKDVETNDLTRLKKLYQIEKKRFVERRKQYEEMGHIMDLHQFYLEDILLKKEELFYMHNSPTYNDSLGSIEGSGIGFDYEFIHRDTGNISWKKETQENISSDGCAVTKISTVNATEEKDVKHLSSTKSSKGKKDRGARLYACEVEGCNKRYTSSFGLKYHMKEGHSQKKMNVFKPFCCSFSGCGKKYKNNNGLKYHMKHCHREKLLS